MHKIADSEYEDLMAKLWGKVPSEESVSKKSPDWKSQLNDLGVKQPAAVKTPKVTSNIPGFQRMKTVPSKELQQIAQQILNRNRTIGTQTPFQHQSVSYVALVEPHAPGPRNPKVHPGVSLFQATAPTSVTPPANKFVRMTQRSLSGLNPKLKPLAEQFIDIAVQQGIGVVITQGYRSSAEQDRLYQQGRTTKGPIVTNAKPGSSKHNYGVAFDVALVDERGQPTWKSSTPGVWDKLGQIGESLGLKWGGRWKGFVDRPHFELPVSMRDLLSGKFPTPYKRTAARIDELKKIAVELQRINITPQEQQIFDLLLDVVEKKTSDTVLRVAGGWIRDKLLGKDSNDIDISINNMSGEDFANLVVQYMDENSISHKGGVSVVKANPDQSKHLATAMVNIFGSPIDFVNLRKEEYAHSRIPTVEPGTPEEDASRRDLTINSLFYNVNEGKIEDFVGGLEDLKQGVARTPIDPVQTFIDDPLRILRTIRFSAKYNLSLAPELIEAANTQEVQESFRGKISKERIWKELAGGKTESGEWKAGFMAGPDPAKAASLMAELGLRDILLGLSEEEMKQLGITKGMVSFESEQHNPHHDLNIWAHTMKVLEYLVKHETTPKQKEQAEDFLVRNLSALLHDVGKCDLCAVQMYSPDHPEYKKRIQSLLDKYNLEHEGELWTFHGHAESSAKIAEFVLTRMGAPNNITKRVVALVRAHMKPHAMVAEVSDKTLRRFVGELAGDWRNSMDLAIADAHGKELTDPETRQKYVNLINRIDQILNQMGGHKVKPPITGKDLIDALGFKSGPAIGQALKALHDKLLEIPTLTRDEALSFVKSLNLI